MHFAGLFLRRKAAITEWDDSLARCGLTGAGASALHLWSVGRIRLIADPRLVQISSGLDGHLINSGSLIPADTNSVAISAADPARLDTCLASCRGNFAGAHASSDGERLTLFSDLLGTHPVYYADQGDVFVFATSQRVLVDLLRGRLSTDTDGLLELCTFGFPLADRTVYKEVRCIDAAQILIVDAASSRSMTYFDWRKTQVAATDDLPSLAIRAHAAFTDGIRKREQRDSQNYTLLSGGMDSRAIVATQTALGVFPQTLSISHPRALDAELARQAASALGCRFSFYPIEHSAFSAVGGVAGAVHDLLARTAPLPDKCVRIWSGDGGSVGLGGVYLSDVLLRHASAGDHDRVAKTFLVENGLSGPSRRLFAAELDVASFATTAIVRELSRFSTVRRVQIPYLFLLLNDQRRHLHYFFELDFKVPLEFVTPFWDSEFMRVLLECPDEQILYHRFYSIFFEQLTPSARQVPWQTYPGHVPCDLTMPAGFECQWNHGPRLGDVQDARRRARRVLRSTLSRRFPAKILRRAATALASGAVLWDKAPARAYLVHQAEAVLEAARPTFAADVDRP